MTILLEHPIAEPPKKPGYYWVKCGENEMTRVDVAQKRIDNWKQYTVGSISWYEEITLPDDTIIVQ